MPSLDEFETVTQCNLAGKIVEFLERAITCNDGRHEAGISESPNEVARKICANRDD
jgi:hypothetical protein